MKKCRALILGVVIMSIASCGSGSSTDTQPASPLVAECVPAPDALCRGADLSGANLAGKSLVGIDLRDADLSRADLSGADLTQAVLIGADLSNANLDGAVLARATAKDAEFSGATVKHARFTNANLADADFTGVDVTTALATAAVTEGAAPAEVIARFLDDDVRPSASETAIDPAPKNAAVAADVAPLLEELTYRISRDRVAPTKAARRYAYVALAQFAAAAPADDTLLTSVNDFVLSGERPDSADPVISAVVAGSVVARSLFVINADKTTIAEVADGIIAKTSGQLTGDQLASSFAWGSAVGQAVIERSKRDGFTESLKIAAPEVAGSGIWVPTPPNYQPAIDPGWGNLAPFFASTAKCSLAAPKRGADADSPYQEQADQVAAVAAGLTDEQKSIARFWDDGRGRTGTPAGHWMVIGLEAAKSKMLPAVDTFAVIAHEMMTVSDAFVGVWREKYKWMVERPVTVLQRTDPTWSPYLMTPAFPEYPSGHSGISRAAADVLTSYFGTFAFDDPGYGVTEQSRRQFTVTPRSFASFAAAAAEASQSRLYAGIHFPMGIAAGSALGACIGKGFVARRG